MAQDKNKDGNLKQGIENSTRPFTPPSLTVDVEKYEHFLENSGLSQKQKEELLQSTWSIIYEFISLGFVKTALEGFATGHFATQSEVRRYLESQPEYPSHWHRLNTYFTCPSSSCQTLIHCGKAGILNSNKSSCVWGFLSFCPMTAKKGF